MEEYRPVSFSKTTLTELMIPSYANFGGKIHGGIILSLMDKAAYACSGKHAGRYCVTVTVDNVEFLQPIEVGEMVYMHASIIHVGKTSMMVGIKVIAENFEKGIVKHTNTSYFTMVAKNQEGKPSQVPGLLLESKEEIRSFLEALERKERHGKFKKQLQDAYSQIILDDELERLRGHRCKLAFPS